MIQGATTPQFLNRLLVRENERICPVTAQEVILFEVDDKYVNLIIKDSRFYIRNSLNALGKQLNPEHFSRIHDPNAYVRIQDSLLIQ